MSFIYTLDNKICIWYRRALRVFLFKKETESTFFVTTTERQSFTRNEHLTLRKKVGSNLRRAEIFNLELNCDNVPFDLKTIWKSLRNYWRCNHWTSWVKFQPNQFCPETNLHIFFYFHVVHSVLISDDHMISLRFHLIKNI